MKRKNLVLIPSVALTLLSVFNIYTGQGLIAWFGAVFFGFCTIVLAIQAIKNLKGDDNSDQPYDPSTHADRINDHGIFSYSESGFNVEIEGSKREVSWNDVNAMFAYKRDLWTTDTICLDIFCTNDFSFHIEEETAGWFQFTQRSKKALPSIDPRWDVEITVPAFATKFTLIYDRQNRSLKEAQKYYYKD
jgi:hypothetical protein